MAAQHESISSAPREREISITRILDAPRHLVYSVWTEAHHVKNWWGPRHFSNPVCEMDVRPGGIWRMVMRGPDGRDLDCHFVYREVAPLERIVFELKTMIEGEQVLDSVTTVTFEELGGKTKLTVRSKAAALVDAALAMLQGMEMGWTQTVDKLQEWTAEAAARTISITRWFDAPRELVFDVFTDRTHIGNFWGPHGFSLTIDEMDVQPGGRWKFIMHGPDGRDYRNEVVYREVARPERLVLDHVTPPHHRTTIMLAEEAGGTRLSFENLFDSAALCHEIDAKVGATKGLNDLVERLAGELAKLK